MKLRICGNCNEHFTGQECPHCQESPRTKRSGTSLLSVALILGLGLSACGEKDEDSGDDTETEETEEPASEPDVAEPADEDLDGVPSSN